MSRIIFVPQYPTKLRYQEWWFHTLPDQFRKAGFDVWVLGEDWIEMFGGVASDAAMFSPISTAITFETEQINEYMQTPLKEDDILFLADISFPGFFSNVLYHKRPKKCFAFCHATSKNNLDYFSPVEFSKFPVEEAHASLFKTVFVGSQYHRDKLRWPNAEVTYLPYPNLKSYFNTKNKKHKIVSASRITPQKVDLRLERLVQENFYPIGRKDHKTWEDYYKFLSESEVLLITAREETFGYQVVDAVINGCIPIAPNKFSYPELLPHNYLYNDEDELMELLDYIFRKNADVPKLLCDKMMVDFYSNIIKTLKEA